MDNDFSILVIGMIIGLVMGIGLVLFLIYSNGNIVLNKEVLIKNNTAHYSTTDGSFILDTKGANDGK